MYIEYERDPTPDLTILDVVLLLVLYAGIGIGIFC
jgi:hypothetical protein